MPLQTQPKGTDSYIRHTRVYFSNEDQAVVPTGTALFNYSITLKDEIPNVIGCELTDFTMAKQLTPTFRGRYIIGSGVQYASASNTRRASPAGNCIFDVRIEDIANATTIVFVVDLELIIPTPPAVPYSLAGRVMSMASIGTEVATAIRLAMNAVGDATINTTNDTLAAGIDSDGCFYCYAYETAVPANKLEITFLFKTGANISDSPHRVLGFPALVDTIPDPTTNGVQATSAVDPNPIRYVDINITQFRELKPLARLFTKINDNFSSPVDRPNDFRLLTEPPRNLTKLDISLEFNDRQTYSVDADVYHEIGLDIISLESINEKPNWVDQKILI